MIGSLWGAGAGLISGITQDFENKDDFFKDYYGNLYEERLSASETALTAGSTTAGSREQSYKAFEKRLGTAQANSYLAEVKSMAAQTNYGYDEILGYSKLLLNSYAPEETFGLRTEPRGCHCEGSNSRYLGKKKTSRLFLTLREYGSTKSKPSESGFDLGRRSKGAGG